MSDNVVVLTCPRCGADLVADALTCAYCGARLAVIGEREVAVLPDWVELARADVAAGRTILAIKRLRWHTDLGLREAKELIDEGGLAAAVIAHAAGRLWEVELQGHPEPLRVTGNHSLLTEHGWERTDRIVPGDSVRIGGGDRALARVVSVRQTTRVVPVFNLRTVGEHTFVVDDVVVHNFTAACRLRVMLYRIAGFLIACGDRLLRGGRSRSRPPTDRPDRALRA